MLCLCPQHLLNYGINRGIAVPAGLQRIVLGEYLDSFPPPASLDCDTQPQGKAANVDAAIPRWERLRQEYPEMSAPMTLLKSRLHPILPEVEAELEEIRERILIVRVDGHPLRALGGRVDGVEADSDFAFEVAADCVQRQAQPLAGSLVLGSVIVMPGTFRVGSVGLEGVGAAVNEETEVIRYHPGGPTCRLVSRIMHPRVLALSLTSHIISGN